MTAPTTASPASLLTRLKADLISLNNTVGKYYAHASAQAIVWVNIADKDLTKWESAASVLGAAGLVGTLKKIQAWLATA